MGRLIPHDAKPKARLYNDEPTLYFTPEAVRTMQAYIEECNEEVGWLGMVEKYDDEVYLCTEVHLLHQEVGPATTEITPEGLVKYAEEVGLERMDSIRLWGHSHVNMGVSPSGQDENQMELFENNGCEWFFRIIANKKGAMSVSFFNYVGNYIVDDIPWDVYYPVSVDLDVIKAEIADKVKKKTYTQPAVTPYKGNTYVGRTPYSDYDYYGGGYWNDKWENEKTSTYNTQTNTKTEKKSVGESIVNDDDDVYAWVSDKIMGELEEVFSVAELFDISEGEPEYAKHYAITKIMEKYGVDFRGIGDIVGEAYGYYSHVV